MPRWAPCQSTGPPSRPRCSAPASSCADGTSSCSTSATAVSCINSSMLACAPSSNSSIGQQRLAAAGQHPFDLLSVVAMHDLQSGLCLTIFHGGFLVDGFRSASSILSNSPGNRRLELPTTPGTSPDFVNVLGSHWKGKAEVERVHAAMHSTLHSVPRQRMGQPRTASPASSAGHWFGTTALVNSRRLRPRWNASNAAQRAVFLATATRRRPLANSSRAEHKHCQAAERVSPRRRLRRSTSEPQPWRTVRG